MSSARRNTRSQRGNALFMILLAVVLFAALNYAVTNSTRGEGKNASSEIASLTAADLQQYVSLVENTVMRLTTSGGCTSDQISYETPSGTGVNSNAPADKRCHVFRPEGGGVTYRNLGAAGCAQPLTTLTVGQQCGDVVYAGVSGSRRIYTATADLSNASWNVGNTSYTTTGINSASDGLANTNALVVYATNGPYRAAVSCRNLGTQWYLPARDELNVLYNNRTTGALNGTFSNSSRYWSSTEGGFSYVWHLNFSGGTTENGFGKQELLKVRCVRRD